MNNYEKILNYAKKNNGYITSKEVQSLKVNRAFISNLARYKKLEKVGKGIYKLPGYPIDNFYIVSKTSKNMCYSHSTALYLYGMSDRVPLVLDITVPYNYSGNLLNDKDVSLRYVKNSTFNLGITTVMTENNLVVKCYDIERTICDIVKDKNKMDKEIYSKALKSYAKLKNKDILKLVKYSKILNIEKELMDLMEVLL